MYVLHGFEPSEISEALKTWLGEDLDHKGPGIYRYKINAFASYNIELTPTDPESNIVWMGFKPKLTENAFIWIYLLFLIPIGGMLRQGTLFAVSSVWFIFAMTWALLSIPFIIYYPKIKAKESIIALLTTFEKCCDASNQSIEESEEFSDEELKELLPIFMIHKIHPSSSKWDDCKWCSTFVDSIMPVEQNQQQPVPPQKIVEQHASHPSAEVPANSDESDGQEWLKYDEQIYYREIGSSGEWTKYQG